MKSITKITKKITKKDPVLLLADQIGGIDNQFRDYAVKQVNTALTLRNWLIGYHIFEFEQKGSSRAEYGEKLLQNLAEILKKKKLIGMSYTNLKLFRQFYLIYPQIGQSVTDQFKLPSNPVPDSNISKFKDNKKQKKQIGQSVTDQFITSPDLLINRLSFTHIIELLKAETQLKRYFYETESMVNNWSVRQLQRAMNSMLFERTGLSKNKKEVIKSFQKNEKIDISNVLRNPYMLEFLGLHEKPEYTENDFEQAIINHLQSFLIEMGRGFCFESRQKRITFDNTHYYIDLVFYHRILKCHVLIDLKIGEFTHADSGQMEIYLNYYKEMEKLEGDNDPIGIILCSGKNEQLARYATGDIKKKMFVSKYMINLPKEEELTNILMEEQYKLLKK